MRIQDVVTLRSRWLTILDPPALQRAAQFSPNDLHRAYRDPVRTAGTAPSLLETGCHEASHRRSSRERTRL